MTSRNANPAAEEQIIGRVTRYHGDEHPCLRGYDVRIVAILHLGNTAPDADGEIRGYERLESDDEIARYGGVTANDRVEVAPFIAREGRFSWVTSDPRAIDLACLAHLTEHR
ncbi:MAG: hypothetical protein RBU30_12930 [Polyangia bacterium]|jgi:hypothetical protein|nr:hypothetical protein [Polyangia bacterium]